MRISDWSSDVCSSDLLVDFVDIDDAALRLFDVVVGGLKQFQDDVLDILADIAGFGQCRRVGHGEGHVAEAGEGLCEQSLAAAGRADAQHVRFTQLDLVPAARVCESIGWPSCWAGVCQYVKREVVAL